jgi:hypothetical protein
MVENLSSGCPPALNDNAFRKAANLRACGLAVLRGAREALAAGRVRHLVFEEHAGPGSRVCRLLADLGYALFGIGWRLAGPILYPPDRPRGRPYEAPNFLAPRDPAGAAEPCRPRGWACLHRA